MTSNEQSESGIGQQTLGGQTVEMERRTCRVYPDDICGKSAEYDFGDVIACDLCAEEITEPERPENTENARRLSGREKWVTEATA